MRTPFVRILVLAVVCLAAPIMSGGVAVAQTPADAHGDALSVETSSLLDAELDVRPGGLVVGNEIFYEDGTVFVAVDAGVLSIDQCTSGRFCGWSQANYSGSFYYTTGTGVTTSLSWTARSYRNNRTQVAHLYNSSASASTCFTPGQSRPTIGSTYYSPDKVNLSSSTSC